MLGIAALLVSAGFGGDWFGLRTSLLGSDAPAAVAPVTARSGGDNDASATTVDDGDADPTLIRSQPWWQPVVVLDGEGADELPVTIDDRAIQWRLRWSCDDGELVVDAGEGETLLEAACPGDGLAYATTTGPTLLQVSAAGRWTLELEQQLDVPLIEPPLPAMDPASTLVATGTFYDLEQVGRGTILLHRLSDGTHALRLEDFYVTPNIDLEVRFSVLAAPRSTAEYERAESVFVAPLDITAGSMNLTVPADVDPSAWRSVVIWCPPLQRAYAAATLSAP